MKTSFLSLFAFAGIFACALAAPTRDPGAAVKVAVEERDVNIGLFSIINTGYVNIQKTNAVINSTVADVKANKIEKSVAVDKIKNELMPSMVACINNMTAEARKEAAVGSMSSGALANVVGIVQLLLFEIHGTLSQVASILDLNSLGNVVSLLAAAISTLLNSLITLVAGLLNALSGVLNGVLVSLNGLLGNLLGNLLGGLGLGGLLQGL
ncbi:hypothetical protein HDK77DRAFT_483833 [Phyllosticta capitalensis]